MYHIFNCEIAKIVGVNAATILQNIQFWHDKNKANGINFYDGKYWTYNSSEAFLELFSYLTKSQIRTAISKLLKEEFIFEGNYNAIKYDRTKWYSPNAKKLKSICDFSQIELSYIANPIAENHQPIPYSKPYSKPNNINKRTKRFIKPSVDELSEYFETKFNADKNVSWAFYDHYESNGWKVGKNPMKDWKAACRNWIRMKDNFSNKKISPNSSKRKFVS